MGNTLIVTKKHENTIKCYLAINFHCQQALLEVLHSHGVPTDPEELYNFFIASKAKIIQLGKKGVLKDDQIDLLLPQNQRTFSGKWDVTLICVVIINFSTLPAPTTGWKKNPNVTDVTVAAIVLKVRHKRNIINHASLKTFEDSIAFNDYYTEIDGMLCHLNYSKIKEFRALNIKSIDVDKFMDDIQCLKERKDVITQCLQWYKKENEKSKFMFVILIITMCISFFISMNVYPRKP